MVGNSVSVTDTIHLDDKSLTNVDSYPGSQSYYDVVEVSINIIAVQVK